MFRCLLVMMSIAGCSFEVKTDDPATARDAAPDANEDAIDSAIDGVVAAPFCDPSDLGLVGCWAFEGDASDGSSYANHATVTAATFAPGKVGDAIELTAASYLLVADSASLDLAAFTIEAWVRDDNLAPPSGRSGIVDNDGQYGVFTPTGGALHCVVQPGGFGLVVSNALAAGQWTHVACTYDSGTLTIYVDGMPRQAVTGGPALDSSPTGATALGANRPAGDVLEGALDQVRIWSRARTAGEICVAAGAC